MRFQGDVIVGRNLSVSGALDATSVAMDSGSFSYKFTVASLTANRTINFPDADGLNGQALLSDGSGNLIWHTPTGALSLGTANGLSLVSQVLSLGLATSSAAGALSAADWTTFNGKQNTLSFGNVTTSTTGVTVGGSFTGAVVGSGVSVDIQTASGTQPGLLSAANWTTFNSKQSALGYTPLDAAGTIAMSGNLAMGGNKITGLASGTSSGQALQWGQIGAANGIAPLDSGSKIPVAFLPSVVMEYQGNWNPALNTPTLSDATGANGNVYWVNTIFAGPVAGLADSSMVNFQIGDLVMFSASTSSWQLSTPAAGVRSVNGTQGNVTVNAISQLSSGGDVTTAAASGSQALVATLATVNSNVGTYTLATVTVDAKGRITSVSSGTSAVTAVTALSPLFSSGGTSPQISIQVATNSQDGYLSHTDWTTFNSKQASLSFGNVTTSTTGVALGGTTTAAVVGAGFSIDIATASTSLTGLLSSSDWNTFNGKQAALGYTAAHAGANSDITSLSGLTTALSIAQGGTNSGSALTGNKAIVSNGTAIIESTTTAAEIGYVSGVTSSIQSQLNGKQASLGYTAAHAGANSDITSITGLTTMLAITQGGTGSNTTGGALANLGAQAALGYVPAHSGSNSDITSISGLTTMLPVNQGGTGGSTSLLARQGLGSETVFNGIENNTLFAVTYSASTRQFTITYSAGAAFTVGSVRYTKSGSDVTTAHANTNGLWFCYYDNTGTIQVSQTPWNLLVTAPIATVYYNSANLGVSAAGVLSYELHSGDVGMPPSVHLNLHTTRGTQLVSGIVASGYTLNTSGLANVSYALSAGTVADEDLVLSTTAQLQGGANTYRILYQTGSSGTPSWNWKDDAEGGIYSNGTDIYYNQLNGGSWQLTAINTNLFVNYWVLATTATSAPQVVVVMGQNTYASQVLAQAATFASDVSNINLFTAEGVVVYQMTYGRSGAYGAPGNTRLLAVTKVVSSLVTVSTGTTVSANSVTVNSAGFVGRLSAGDTTVQQALNDLDTNVTSIALGGTGQITANAALNALLPAQTGNAGYVLMTNGTNASWSGTRYVSTFNATSSWTDAAGYYSIVFTAATHGRGVNPIVQLYQTTGTDNDLLFPDRIRVASNGDVTIRIPDGSPDDRFAGEIVIL